MSFNALLKTYNDVLDYLKTADHPQCFTVNYKPETEEYELWIGNQPYYAYEKWIDELDFEIKKLKQRNQILEQEAHKLSERIIKLRKKNKESK